MKLKRFGVVRCMAVVAVLFYACTAISVAEARTTIHKGAGLTVGLSVGADPYLVDGSSSSQSKWAGRARSVGTQSVRLDVNWSSVAPGSRPKGFNASNPGSTGYRWSGLDSQVKQLSAEGFQILLTVQSAPKWAEGAHMPKYALAGTWKPNNQELSQFAHALAERYDGHYDGLPRITDFQAWNEPNMSQYLAPQWRNDNGKCTTSKSYWNGSGQLSPTLYRGMANAFYEGVKGADRSDVVVLGGLAPYGNPNCEDPGKHPDYRMSPVPFTRALFCLDKSDRKAKGCNVKTRFDAIDTHPYPPPWTGLGPNWNDSFYSDIAVPDVVRITRLVSAAQRANTIDRGHIGNWVTEIAWDTNPPDKYGVSATKAAFWIEDALYILWKQGVNHVLWWQLGDLPNFKWTEWPGGAGLYTSAGKAKPGTTAFRFPFITHRTAPATIEAWGRAPSAGTLRIERKSGSHWSLVSSAHVSATEVFKASIHLNGSATYRAQIGDQTSLDWKQS